MSGKKILVTGASGFIGGAVCAHFAEAGWAVHGVDNDMGATFFGPEGDTRWNQHRLQTRYDRFHHHEFALAEQHSGRRMEYDYVDRNREGGHICYISDLPKIRSHYPAWDLSVPLTDIFAEIYQSWMQRMDVAAVN